jgi:hypothetical protein
MANEPFGVTRGRSQDFTDHAPQAEGREEDAPVAVILHPPAGSRTSWYAYWNGLVSSKSTGQRDYEQAVKVVENMVRNGGQRAAVADTVLSDEEFEAVQRAHFGRIHDPAEKVRAGKTLASCLEAIDAFRQLSSLKPVTSATADDCAAFQRKALQTPRNWRKQ